MAMTKEETYQYLNERRIEYEVMEHKAVFTMQELDDLALPYPQADAKNLFIRDDKRKNYYLITVKGNKRVDLKRFRKQFGLRPLSFASENELQTMLGLMPGSVTPLGLLNDLECKVHFYLDQEFAEGKIAVRSQRRRSMCTSYAGYFAGCCGERIRMCI